MSLPNVIKVKPWSEDQGDHVLINEADFDPSVHVRFDEAADASTAKPTKAKAPKKAAEPEAGTAGAEG